MEAGIWKYSKGGEAGGREEGDVTNVSLSGTVWHLAERLVSQQHSAKRPPECVCVSLSSLRLFLSILGSNNQ